MVEAESEQRQHHLDGSTSLEGTVNKLFSVVSLLTINVSSRLRIGLGKSNVRLSSPCRDMIETRDHH